MGEVSERVEMGLYSTYEELSMDVCVSGMENRSNSETRHSLE